MLMLLILLLLHAKYKALNRDSGYLKGKNVIHYLSHVDTSR